MINAILLMGPTATGKTDLALKLAEILPIEIISVDSGLIYKHMDIGTAKPTTVARQDTTHHLIDIISPLESYSVANFINNSVCLIREMNARAKIPLLVGGTMMYYNGLLNGLSCLPGADATIRAQLEMMASEGGWLELYTKLQQVDPLTATRIKSTDKQRISRALEVYYKTGTPLSVLQSRSNIKQSVGINFLSLAIIPENRGVLHQRIETRFMKMLDSGFIEEMENLQKIYPELTAKHTSMRCVGYSQMWRYMDKQISKPELKDMGIAATRQLAKRQITWLRHMKNLINLDTNDLDFNTLYANLKKSCIGYLEC